MSKTFIATGAIGQMMIGNQGGWYAPGRNSSNAEDAAFAELERQVDGLADRVKDVLKPGVIEKMVSEALKPFEGTIRAKADEIRNSAKPRRAGILGEFRLPAASTEDQEMRQRIANAQSNGFRLPKAD